MTLVAALEELGGDDLAVAGGKGANLGELVRLGVPVPPGFVVTTRAYEQAVEAAGLDSARLDPDGDGEKLRTTLEEMPVPGPVWDAIAEAYARLKGGPVAVRSSATAEDLPGAAFAGQQDTYLNVQGKDAVLDAVRRCWASLWTDRAIAYRRKRGIDDRDVRIAVVVQSMVDAAMAGVMFTADPVSGRRDRIVVDASAGLGEAVVSGLVTPDHYVLDRDARVVEFSAGRREVVVRSAAGGGVVHETHESGRGGGDGGWEDRLPEDVLADLVRLGALVERHFGRPQDIEWAYAGGRVHLLQARPMTALPPPPMKLSRRQREIAAGLMDYFSLRPYPIDMSSWVPGGPVGMMLEIMHAYGLRIAVDEVLPEADGVVDRFVPPSPRPTLRVVPGVFRALAHARRYDPARWTDDPRFLAYQRDMAALAAVDVRTLPWERLLRVPRQALDLVRPLTDLRAAYLPASGLALLRLGLTLLLLRRYDLLGDLLTGARTRTQDANEALQALAARVRDDRRLHEALEAWGREAAGGEAPDVSWLAGFGDFKAAFDAFLEEYGHRETASPILMTSPTLGEAPWVVLDMIRLLAEGGRAGVDASMPPAGTDRLGEKDRPGDSAVHRLLAHPRLRRRRARERVRRRVEAARAGVAFREDSHFYFIQPLPVLRRAVLEIGRRLVAGGVLAEVEDVYHLRLEELERLPDPERAEGPSRASFAEARSVVRARKARREELAGVPMINPSSVFPPADSEDALVTGVPVGGGTVTGPVRVVRGPEEFGRLRSGDVLVCPYTNPSWTPLFQRAAAVVVDSGGATSHAAIVAREYGIPAVMGTGDGTRVLTDGRLVTVDGTAGRVTAADDVASGDS